MKQGKALITFVMVLLAAALMCYLGYYGCPVASLGTLRKPKIHVPDISSS